MTERIISNPNILHGKACIKGTRIPVYLVLDLLASGMTANEIIDEYPDLTEDDIAACIKYASIVAKENVFPLEAAQ